MSLSDNKSHGENGVDLDSTTSGTFKSRNDELLQSIRGVAARKRIRGDKVPVTTETDTSSPTKVTAIKVPVTMETDTSSATKVTTDMENTGWVLLELSYL